MTKHNKNKKPLSLNSETVRALQDAQLDAVAGGTQWTYYRCSQPPYCPPPRTPACPQ